MTRLFPDNNKTFRELPTHTPLRGSTSYNGRQFHSSEGPARYPYEENAIPETPAEELQITYMQSNTCAIELARTIEDGDLVIADNATVFGTAGLILGLERNTEKANVKFICTFRLSVPQGGSN